MLNSSDNSGHGMDLFDLAERRLAWIGQRQQQLARNISNADTPNYQSRDLTPFAAFMSSASVRPMRTSPLHLEGRFDSAISTRPLPRERAPDGNAVSVENELTKVADDETQAALVGNLWKSYMGMYANALGRSG